MFGRLQIRNTRKHVRLLLCLSVRLFNGVVYVVHVLHFEKKKISCTNLQRSLKVAQANQRIRLQHPQVYAIKIGNTFDVCGFCSLLTTNTRYKEKSFYKSRENLARPPNVTTYGNLCFSIFHRHG